MFDAVHKFQCELSNDSYCGECVRHLNERIGEHNAVSPLTKKLTKPKDSTVSSYLLLCNHSKSFENFSVLTKKNRNLH